MFLSAYQSNPIEPRWIGNNMKNNNPQIVFDPRNLKKERTFITREGQIITDKDDPQAIEKYLQARYGNQ